MSKLDAVYANYKKLYTSIDNILNSLKEMDLPTLPTYPDENSFDKILDKASSIGESIMSGKKVNAVINGVNRELSDIADYSMLFSIPVLVVAVATGSVGGIFVAPLLAVGGYATKKYVTKEKSVIGEASALVRGGAKFVSNTLKEKKKQKMERKCLQNQTMKEVFENKNKISLYQFVAISMKRATTTITKINDKVSYILGRIKKEDFKCNKDELVSLLQYDVIDSIVSIKKDVGILTDVKKETDFQPQSVSAVIHQCEIAIQALKENMCITDKMILNRMTSKTVKNNSIELSI